MGLPQTPAADLSQICRRPAAESRLFHMQISFAADSCRSLAAYYFSVTESLRQICGRLFIMNIHVLWQTCRIPAAYLPQPCCSLAAYSFSVTKSLRQICRRLLPQPCRILFQCDKESAADLPQTLHHEYSCMSSREDICCGRPFAYLCVCCPLCGIEVNLTRDLEQNNPYLHNFVSKL